MKKRLNTLCLVLLVGISLGLPGGCRHYPPPPDKALEAITVIPVTVLFFNDIHGHLQPFTIVQDDEKIEVGGIARLATLITRIEDDNRAAGALTYTLIAGDILQGTPMSTVFMGKPDIECFNMMGVDAITVGNHEFDFGLENFLFLKQHSRPPFLSSNVIWKESGELVCQPYVSLPITDNLNLTVIGVTTEQLMTTTKPSNVAELAVTDAVTAVRRIYDAVEGGGPVILLSHSRARTDEAIAEAVPELNAIIGGHDQILLNPRKLVGEVPVFQAFEKGKYLGRLDFSVDTATGEAELVAWEYLPISADIPLDEAINAHVEQYHQQLDAAFQEVIGKALVFLDAERGRIRYEETNLGDLITDIMREYTSADIALLNGGSLRASIAPGDITVEDVFKTMPYANEVVVLELDDDTILETMKRSVSATREEEDGGFLHISGMRMVIRERKPMVVTVAGEPLEAGKMYRVAVTDFMSTGGDGYHMLVDAPSYKTGSPLRELIVDTIRARGEISAAEDGRITRE
ncbi:5'-nucleotidase C-terminal domain-containing protein [bacterium]|nr:5'-nucleotidase C-terminal domain-containing protein [candidate division CSSED10-310 bacterium]